MKYKVGDIIKLRSAKEVFKINFGNLGDFDKKSTWYERYEMCEKYHKIIKILDDNSFHLKYKGITLSWCEKEIDNDIAIKIKLLG